MADIDDINVSTPFFSIGAKTKDNIIRLTEGEAVIVKKNIGTFWHPKYIRKVYTLINGKVKVQIL